MDLYEGFMRGDAVRMKMSKSDLVSEDSDWRQSGSDNRGCSVDSDDLGSRKVGGNHKGKMKYQNDDRASY